MADECHPVSDEGETTDVAYDVLSHPQRRAVLSNLQTHDRPRAIVDVAKSITADRRDASVDEIPFDEIDRSLTMLQHVHLPKLEDAGAVRVEGDRNTVVLTPRGERLCDCMDYVAEQLARLRLSSRYN